MIELTSLNDPTLLRFYAARKELLSTVEAADIDVVSCHEKLLGRTIPGCMSALARAAASKWIEWGPSPCRKIRRTPSVVQRHHGGLLGGFGNGLPECRPRAPGRIQESRHELEAEYIQATDSREVFRSVSRYTVSDGALFMTTNAGVDNRTLLPPFFPVGRNEDGAFAVILHACAEDALIGHLPVCHLSRTGGTAPLPAGRIS